MASPQFETDFDPAHGQAVAVAADVVRVTANNRGPLTFHGTNSYIIDGGDRLAVLDPGPADDDSHYEALLRAVDGRPVSHIVITHTHMDHSPLAARLKADTGARIVGCAKHHAARPLFIGEQNPLDGAVDHHYEPDQVLAHGASIMIGRHTLTAIATPGHTANHLAYGLGNTGITFSGDHVMAWATSIVAPPDGAMSDYMASLDTMIARNDRLLLPGHGGPVRNPEAFMRGLKAHRKLRERAIVERIHKGDRKIPDIVAIIYRSVDKRLHGAAGLSVLAHLEDLVARGVIATDGPVRIDGDYWPTTPMSAASISA